jgi:thioredoxin 1
MTVNKETFRNIVVLLIIGLVVVGGFLFNRIRHSPMSSEPEVAASAPQQKSQEEIGLPQKEENIVETGDEIVGPEEKKIEELRSTARITRNEEWLKTQRLATTDNPLDEALKKGRPVLADFGRGVCIPCKQMKPILEELASEYEGKASILVIEIDDYRALTRRYSIRLIPTQIFFDAQRKEVYRHEGFMSKESIEEKLEEMGVK